MWRRLLTNAWGLGPGEYIFLILRWALTPYHDLVRHVPSQGVALDLGCGHGLLALSLAEKGIRTMAVDHDEHRLKAARRAAKNVAQLQLMPGDVHAVPPGDFSCIILMDVLHYFPYAEQERILRRVVETLGSGGKLLVREVEPSRGLTSKLNYFYEWSATRLGFTKVQDKQLFMRPTAQWVALLQSLGLRVSIENASHFLFADILFVGEKSDTK